MLRIVPPTSATLERTTILTWIYQNDGVLEFLELVSRFDADQFPATKRRNIRRALVGLSRIGAITLINVAGGMTTVVCGAELNEESEKTTRIGDTTHAILARPGMTWMLRAWGARYKAMGRNPANLSWAHKVFLEEEEEGKGTEGHWIESMRAGEYVRNDKPAGEITSWMGASVTSVFDLPMVLSNSKRAGKRLQRA